MAELGLRYVRIGEFSWSRVEPARDRFTWDWLDEAVEILGDAGLRVVMCTPTATPPKWLVDQHPTILPWDTAGHPRRFGSRRHYDFSSPDWLRETRRICSLFAKRYGAHPAVAGWQLDNEYGCHDTVLSYSPAAATAFREWLRALYGSIEALNAAWGGAFWSQDYAGFEEVDPPNLTVTEPNPTHVLAYRRFASDQVVAYNRLQADIIRAHSPGRFLAHNFMGFFLEFDHFAVGADLDVVSWDSYPLGFTDQRMNLVAGDRARYARCGHPDAAAFHHDLYRGVAGTSGRWWVMEQQPGPVNWADHNPAPHPGMVRLWTWEAFAHGAEAVSYFRWRQAHFAQEQMHAGLHRPDGSPDRGFFEAGQVASEREELALAGTGRADAALVFDYQAAWVFEIQPHGCSMRYLELVLAFYSALRRLGLDIDVVPPGRELIGYRLIVVPSLPIVSPEALSAFAAAEGPIVFGPRSGSKTEQFQVPASLAPGMLQSVLPMRVLHAESLGEGLVDAMVWRNQSYPVTRWRETLETDLAPIARFTDNDAPALVAGDDVHYIGFWPDDRFLDDYLAAQCREQGLEVREIGDLLRLRRRGDLRFAFNYGQSNSSVPAASDSQFVIGEQCIGPGGVAAWYEAGCRKYLKNSRL